MGYQPPSWQQPEKPPQPEKRRGWRGYDPDNIDPWWTACCLWETLTCCWWPVIGALVVGAALIAAAN